MRIFVDGQEVSCLPRSTSWHQKYEKVCRLIKKFRQDKYLFQFYNRAYHGILYKG